MYGDKDAADQTGQIEAADAEIISREVEPISGRGLCGLGNVPTDATRIRSAVRRRDWKPRVAAMLAKLALLLPWAAAM